jgi:6-pyruvoyltetrahydropterin/6-carboxytetrahydropterin synthase
MKDLGSVYAARFHDFSYGHRVVGHEGKCRNLHGHNGRAHFKVGPAPGRTLDEVGRVLDFSVINTQLCQWVENSWDHRFLVWREDPMRETLLSIDPTVEVVPFNPTAENMALFLVKVVGPMYLEEFGVVLDQVTLEETRKCSVTVNR